MNTLMMNYCLGFMFNSEMTMVALIRKEKPDWQAGKLNGIGGKVEVSDSTWTAAMVREFEEEAGVVTGGWSHFATLTGKDWNVGCFAVVGDLTVLKTMTKEEVVIVPVADLNKLPVLENIVWQVEMAKDHLIDSRPIFASVLYPS